MTKVVSCIDMQSNMSSTDTMKEDKDSNIDAAITEETKRVVMSECSKNDTDKKCTS